LLLVPTVNRETPRAAANCVDELVVLNKGINALADTFTVGTVVEHDHG
jgi:hypothetical protein